MYAFVGFTFVMSALPAEAHLNTTGMGPFYDGLMHFLMSPEDIVPVLALALLAGLRGASHGRRALFTLPVAWLLGALAGLSAVTAKPIHLSPQPGFSCLEDCWPPTPKFHCA